MPPEGVNVVGVEGCPSPLASNDCVPPRFSLAAELVAEFTEFHVPPCGLV